MFKDVLKNLKIAVRNDLKTGYFGKNPSVIGNALMGEPLTANTKWGKPKAYEQQPFKMPNGKTWQPPKARAQENMNALKKVQNYAPSTVSTAALKSPGLTTRPVVSVKGISTSSARPVARPTATPTPTPRYNPSNMTDYENLTRETFNKYDIPEAVAFGIAGAENGGRNRFNIGAFDSNPNNARIQDDLSNATSAARMLSGQAEASFYGNGEQGKQAYANAYAKRKNAAEYLRMIRDAAFAGDPATWKQRSIEQGGAGQFYDSWDEFIKDTPAWRKWYR